MATADPPERRGLSVIKPIDAAKEAVPTIELADRLCGVGQMRRLGGERWGARCPLPDHEDKSPSFVVYPGNGGWHCFGCNRGGDVVELARLAWNYPDDGRGAAEAAAFLLLEFGHELPARPSAWFAKQERQAKARDAIDAALINRQQRRIFAIIWRSIARDVKEGERDAEIEAVWDESRDIARLVVASRRAS